MINRVFDFVFKPCRQRPVGESKPPSREIKNTIKNESKVISRIPQMREPFGIAHHRIELIAMQDKKAFTGGSFMHDVR